MESREKKLSGEVEVKIDWEIGYEKWRGKEEWEIRETVEWKWEREIRVRR